MLSLELIREVPEALKPRKIAINVGPSTANANDVELIEGKSGKTKAA
jgi:molecular chaperone IbpA